MREVRLSCCRVRSKERTEKDNGKIVRKVREAARRRTLVVVQNRNHLKSISSPSQPVKGYGYEPSGSGSKRKNSGDSLEDWEYVN